MKTIEINEKKYEIIEDFKEAIDKDVLKEKITDYYDDFDYISLEDDTLDEHEDNNNF